jgi:2-methylisocitrate lyase-like PEP mutase family enzyme
MAPEPLITQAKIAQKAGNEALYLSSLESAEKSLTVADVDFHFVTELKKCYRIRMTNSISRV